MKKYIKFLFVILIITIMILYISSVKFYANAATYNQVTTDAYKENRNGIELFPESYQILLNKLVENTGHTNWNFRALYTDIDWNELVENETDCLHNTLYKSIPATYPNTWYDSCNQEGDYRYFCASKEITSYYMDPRNFLTETTIFQFLDLSNSSTVSVSQIQDAVRGTYLAGSVNGESYAEMIHQAAEQSGESAFSIIVRIFQELGSGTELPYMISGKDSTYPGVYNFFNYGATDGAGNLQRGLAYAKKAGWTTPKKALIEGAKLIAGTYTKAGQVNKYLYKFDVVGEEKSQLYRHQYMTNVQDPNSQASTLYKAYDKSNLLENSLTFIIPIYKNMPTYVKKPHAENPNNNLYYVSSNYNSVYWRQSPSSNGGIIGSLGKDTIVTMLQENVNGYGKISCNGTVGYMSMQYLTKVNKIQDDYYIPTQGEKHLGSPKNSDAMISYSAQLQNVGWTDWAKDGETLGITGARRRLETIKISLKDEIKNEKLQYRVHVQDYGWMNWVSDGEIAGTVGEAKRVEAIQIKLKDLGSYNIKYRVCIEGGDWTEWVTNGETAGTTGKAEKITAIEIKLEEAEPWDDRGIQYKGTEKIDSTSLLNYNVHLQNVGWTGWRTNGQEAGSLAQRRKLEAFQIKLNDSIKNESISYRAHVQNVGWTKWAKDGEIAGTIVEAKRIEAIQIKLENGTQYEVRYRVHVQDIGWMDWKTKGETAGTTGELKRIEAIQVELVKPEKYLGSAKSDSAMVSYNAQLQDIGWTNWAKNGETLGVINQNKRLETIKITLLDAIQNEKLQYKVYVQDIGWMNWVSDGEMAGTVGQSKQIESIQIKLRDLGNYDIKYRVCIEGREWSDWVSNGLSAGTAGKGKPITAIEVKIEEAEPWDNRGTQYKGTQNKDVNSNINYNAYLQNAGWTGWRTNGQEAGASGQRRKLEAFKISLGTSVKNEKIKYRVHLQDDGWTNWASDGEIVGSPDGNKRIEAIQIKLENGKEYNIRYRVHVQDIGWMDWVQNEEITGTTGKLKRIEAIQIQLSKKENISISYSAHVQDYNWMSWMKNGETAGTVGESKRIEAIKIKLDGLTSAINNAIQYKVHVEDIGWMDWVSDGDVAGTKGKAKRIEAIQIKLNSQIGKKVKYRVHVQDYGWTNWVQDGEIAGTIGEAKRIEAIEIKLE